MNQILLAAARGARVLLMGQHVYLVYFNTPAWRIHPDDTEYRYGPISRPIYEAAKEPPEDFAIDIYDLPMYVDLPVADWLDYQDATAEHRRMFLLFLAESLVEVGV